MDKFSEVYWTTEQKCRQYTNIISFTYVMFFEGTFVIIFIYAIYSILIGKFDASLLFLPYYMVVPFDTTTKFGWFLKWTIQSIMSFNYSMCVLATTSFFFCCCLYIAAICKHFTILFVSIAEDSEQLRNVNESSKRWKLQKKIGKKLRQAVELHITIFK